MFPYAYGADDPSKYLYIVYIVLGQHVIDIFFARTDERLKQKIIRSLLFGFTMEMVTSHSNSKHTRSTTQQPLLCNWGVILWCESPPPWLLSNVSLYTKEYIKNGHSKYNETRNVRLEFKNVLRKGLFFLFKSYLMFQISTRWHHSFLR